MAMAGSASSWWAHVDDRLRSTGGTSSRGTNVGHSDTTGRDLIGTPNDVPPGPMIHSCEHARRTFSASSRERVCTATRRPTSFRSSTSRSAPRARAAC